MGGEVEGDVKEGGVGDGRADGGDGRLRPLGRGGRRGQGREGGGGEEAEVVWSEEVEAARRRSEQHGERWESERTKRGSQSRPMGGGGKLLGAGSRWPPATAS